MCLVVGDIWCLVENRAEEAPEVLQDRWGRNAAVVLLVGAG